MVATGGSTVSITFQFSGAWNFFLICRLSIFFFFLGGGGGGL